MGLAAFMRRRLAFDGCGRKFPARGIGVRDGDPLEEAALVDEVDQAPVRQHRDRQLGHRRQRGLVLERGGEDAARACEEVQPSGRSLLVLDVGTGAEPAQDAAVFPAQAHGAAEVPAIEPIESANAELGFVRRRLRPDDTHPLGDGRLAIVGVDSVQPLLAQQLLDGPSRKVAGALVEVVDEPVGDAAQTICGIVSASRR